MSNVPVIDLVFLILVILMVIRGHVKGFITEFFSWVALVLSIWAAVLFHPAGAEFIRGKVMKNVEHIPEVLAFVGIFAIIMLLVKMIEHILKDVILGAKLGGANRFLGAVFGLVEGLTLTALLLFLLSIQPLFDASNIIVNSNFARILLPIIRIPLEQGAGMVKTALLLLPLITPA